MVDMRSEDASGTALKKEVLSFRLGQEEYCLDILSVQEIRGYDTVKERHLEQARAKQTELLAAFRLRSPAEEVERV